MDVLVCGLLAPIGALALTLLALYGAYILGRARFFDREDRH